MSFENQFGRLERALHRFAFRSGSSQVRLADMEDTLFARMLATVRSERPVFVSGLPRSGTTIILQLLVDSGYFAAHTYQDMPFLMTPMFWHRFSRHFLAAGAPRERAHQDGIQVSATSPEAFEEIVWKQFWGDHYESGRIRPWSRSDQSDGFAEFFERHMRKVIAIRSSDSSKALRYVSKNNVNVARLAARPGPLGGGTFIIPFREPLQHSMSMLLQHRRFSRLQSEEPFALQYMVGIGHHDFGLDLRPIDFGGWLEGAGNADRIGFWLRYWIATYGHVMNALGPAIHLMPFEQLSLQPEASLRILARAAGIPAETLVPMADRLRPAKPHDVPLGDVDDELMEEASSLHASLMSRARTRP